MEDCYICYNGYDANNKNVWEILPCNHKLCKKCFNILTKNKRRYNCPFCRHEIIKDFDKTNKNPQVQLNNIELSIDIEISVEITLDIPFSRLERNRIRKRRRNLTFEEIKERRENIKKRCKKKWNNREARLSKTNWYELY